MLQYILIGSRSRCTTLLLGTYVVEYTVNFDLMGPIPISTASSIWNVVEYTAYLSSLHRMSQLAFQVFVGKLRASPGWQVSINMETPH